MNKVYLHGRIARDPEIRTTASGTQYARFSVAVDRPTKAGEEKKQIWPQLRSVYIKSTGSPFQEPHL